jgi:hypothetical protein
MYHEFLGPRGLTTRDPYGYIKTKEFKIGDIHSESVFLYILMNLGP